MIKYLKEQITISNIHIRIYMTKTNLINKINELSNEIIIFLEQRLKIHLIEIDNEDYVPNS